MTLTDPIATVTATLTGAPAGPSDACRPLRFATVGSVDDGKSTLIGRLLHDSKSIFEDQLEHIEAVSRRRGTDYVDLALLTDGLRAEREQGITIDVAYRYFSTPARDFVVADCPGHVQYTRNAITGASTADVAVLLVDARHGVVEQTRRHTLLMSLLRVPHLAFAVNKMDLAGYDRAAYEAIGRELVELAGRAGARDVAVVPISALAGDNVVEGSAAMPWYDGPTLLQHLEAVQPSAAAQTVGLRFPVQYVIRPHRAEFPDYRGYAGTVAAGVLRVGDDVVVLPSGVGSRVARIDTPDGAVSEATASAAVTVVLDADVDVSRGDLLCHPARRPESLQQFDAVLAWMDAEAPLAVGRPYTLKHTTRTVRAMVTRVQHRLDVDTFAPDTAATTLALNDIGAVELRTTGPVLVDDYGDDRTTGSFILIDEATHQTAAAGMIRLAARDA